MDLKDQLKNIFPDHIPKEAEVPKPKNTIWLQDDPLFANMKNARASQ